MSDMKLTKTRGHHCWWLNMGGEAAANFTNESDVDYLVGLQGKQSDWVSVDLSDESSLNFGQEFYFQLANGKCGVGELIDCKTYVRFKFNGTSKAIDLWTNKPIRYALLPTPPKESDCD